ncbi:hypothetical protein FF1_018791 [Malus domestica]
MRQGRSYWVSLIHFLGGKRRIGVNVRVYNGYRKGIGIQSFSICGRLILLKPYSEKEVRVAFFQMHPSKAPGLNAEIGHFLHNKRWGREGSFALKLDMSKAYDRVEWNFLEAMMLRLGFDSRWVAVVMMCVKSVSHYFLVNGEECLSALIAHKEEKGVISGIRICDGALSVHHLLFADDSFLFGKAKLEECVEVQHNLDVFSQASGQEINLGKSSIAFSANVRDRKQQGLAHFLGVQLVERHDRYLGLPTFVGKNK